MSHDYDPCWDYPVIELDDVQGLNEFVKKRVNDIIAEAEYTLAPAMGLKEGFDVFFVEPMGLSSFSQLKSAVAVYCNGTSSRPVIGFDLTHMAEVCEEDGIDLVKQIEVSLAHELGHAYQEAAGVDHHHGNDADGGDDDNDAAYSHSADLPAFDEDAAETFGRNWADFREIELWRLNPSLPNPNIGVGVKP